MKIGFIGAGKVGTAFGNYMHGKGIEIAGYYSRSKESAARASKLTGSCPFEGIQLLCTQSDILIITVPDNNISQIAESLSDISAEWSSKIVCHMSGAYSSDILSELKQKGATVCSLHPMMAFNDLEASVKALEYACFTLDGYGTKLNVILELLQRLGNKYFEISPQKKGLYHTAACMVSNYLVALMDAGIEMFKVCGLDEENVKELIKPIVHKVVNDVFDSGTEKSLTGPISRGDTKTVEKHLKELQVHDKCWMEVYKALAVQTSELAVRANKIDKSVENDIKEVLRKYE